MKRLDRRSALALAASSFASACGAGGGALPPGSPSASPPASTAAAGLDADAEVAPDRAAADAGDHAETPSAVRAGRYRLSLSMHCGAKLTTATGVLTLQPMSGDTGASDASLPGPSEAALLWGQTDLDLLHFLSCLGRPASPAGEPIHPSVLVEVLRWDGELHHQVLLVSTESAKGNGAASGVGVAMWVERAERGHIAGVWSRWELMGRGEGRWEADFLPGR